MKLRTTKKFRSNTKIFLTITKIFLDTITIALLSPRIFICTVAKKNTDVQRLFEKALQAHIRATDAYRKAIEAHRELTQKVITELTREN